MKIKLSTDVEQHLKVELMEVVGRNPTSKEVEDWANESIRLRIVELNDATPAHSLQPEAKM